MTLAERFWTKVERGGPDECWEWQAFRRSDGYGMFRVSTLESMQSSQRVAWTLAHGPIPDGQHVLHHCDNPPCCNPAHLFLETNADNVADKVRKGRASAPQPKKRGELHPLAKLTQAQVDTIRATATGRHGEGRALAARYDVSPATITNILKGKTWKVSEAAETTVPPDAPCVVCGGARPPAAVAHGDPFDTSRCARAAHGCALDPKTERPPRKQRAA